MSLKPNDPMPFWSKKDRPELLAFLLSLPLMWVALQILLANDPRTGAEDAWGHNNALHPHTLRDGVFAVFIGGAIGFFIVLVLSLTRWRVDGGSGKPIRTEADYQRQAQADAIADELEARGFFDR
jgi:hypothetical protein